MTIWALDVKVSNVSRIITTHHIGCKKYGKKEWKFPETIYKYLKILKQNPCLTPLIRYVVSNNYWLTLDSPCPIFSGSLCFFFPPVRDRTNDHGKVVIGTVLMITNEDNYHQSATATAEVDTPTFSTSVDTKDKGCSQSCYCQRYSYKKEPYCLWLLIFFNI